jgi:hypothetical protein
MNIQISSKQLDGFKDFVLASLPAGPALPQTKAIVQFSSTPKMEFGCVRLGGVEGLWDGKIHPMVVVERTAKMLPPAMQIRPGTSVRKTGPGVLCLPEGAVRLQKRGKGLVKTYLYCFLKLLVPTESVREMRFINKLDEEYHEPLRRCLKEVRR